MTPEYLSQDIIQHFNPSGKILDPSRGNGAFYDNFPTDNKDWCELGEGKDFLQYGDSVEWIITNPPWSKIQKFLEHGMKIANNIVYLTTINHYTTKRRIREMREYNFGVVEVYCVPTPKKPWPQMGFQLAAVHTKRDYVGDVKITYSKYM